MGPSVYVSVSTLRVLDNSLLLRCPRLHPKPTTSGKYGVEDSHSGGNKTARNEFTLVLHYFVPEGGMDYCIFVDQPKVNYKVVIPSMDEDDFIFTYLHIYPYPNIRVIFVKYTLLHFLHGTYLFYFLCTLLCTCQIRIELMVSV